MIRQDRDQLIVFVSDDGGDSRTIFEVRFDLEVVAVVGPSTRDFDAFIFEVDVALFSEEV